MGPDPAAPKAATGFVVSGIEGAGEPAANAGAGRTFQSVERVACGSHFTVAVTDRGMVVSWGVGMVAGGAQSAEELSPGVKVRIAVPHCVVLRYLLSSPRLFNSIR
jgi:hypothetical protein